MQVKHLIQCLGHSCNQYYCDAMGERALDPESTGEGSFQLCHSLALLTLGRLTPFSELVVLL